MRLKMNIAKTKVIVVENTPINVNNVFIETVEGYRPTPRRIPGTTLQHLSKEPGQRDTTTDHGKICTRAYLVFNIHQ